MNISIDEIRQLPADQQLSLVEQIWEGLLASGQLLRHWQIEEVWSRVRELNERPELALTEDELWRRVDELRHGH